jgi:hypothetical protein
MPDEIRRVECGNCEWKGREDEMRCSMEDGEDLWERLDAGSEVPAGDCPDCGAFCYLHEEDNPYARAWSNQKITDLANALNDLLAWADHMGGWEAPAWKVARAVAAKVEGK